MNKLKKQKTPAPNDAPHKGLKFRTDRKITKHPITDEWQNITTGEIFRPGTEVTTNEPIEKDNEKFVKIFWDFDTTLLQLNVPEIRLFCYFINQIKKPRCKNRDIIYMTLETVQNLIPEMKEQTYRKTVKAMRDKGIIRKTAYKNEYRFNIGIIFNGDRTDILKDRIENGTEHNLETNGDNE